MDVRGVQAKVNDPALQNRRHDRNRVPDQYDLDAIASAMDGYSGADIEQVVVTGLKLAFHQGQGLSTESLLPAVPEVRPLSQTDPERVAAISGWLVGHAKGAASYVTPRATADGFGTARQGLASAESSR